MLIVLADGEKLASFRRELEAVNGSAMEAGQLSQNLLGGDVPDEDVHHLGFALCSHLPCSYDVAIRMDCQGDDVVLMQIEELLHSYLFWLSWSPILYDSESCSCVYDLAVSCVLLIAAIIMTSEAVCTPES